MNPYSSLDAKYFWAPSVGKREPLEIERLWTPKRNVTKRHKISTYGSCFAQYFGKALVARGYKWMQYEQPPEELSKENALHFNYGVFTTRTANIYTASLLQQWVEWSLGVSTPPSEVWEKEGRFYDPFRPMIEPNGFESEEEVYFSREKTLDAFRQSFEDANIFVFTLGLTESWKNSEGYEYPMCPGTAGGSFNANKHHFHNQSFREIRASLLRATNLMLNVNPKLRFLLTVSPVPLTATMSGNHVLTATVESKSILRTVAGDLATTKPQKYDYFPSYEIISSTPFQGMFYNDNKRTVKQEGVDFVMNSFFKCIDEHFGNVKSSLANKIDTQAEQASSSVLESNDSDPVCEEELLAAFGPNAEKNRLDIAS